MIHLNKPKPRPLHYKDFYRSNPTDMAKAIASALLDPEHPEKYCSRNFKAEPLPKKK